MWAEQHPHFGCQCAKLRCLLLVLTLYTKVSNIIWSYFRICCIATCRSEASNTHKLFLISLRSALESRCFHSLDGFSPHLSILTHSLQCVRQLKGKGFTRVYLYSATLQSTGLKPPAAGDEDIPCSHGQCSQVGSGQAKAGYRWTAARAVFHRPACRSGVDPELFGC